MWHDKDSFIFKGRIGGEHIDLNFYSPYEAMVMSPMCEMFSNRTLKNIQTISNPFVFLRLPNESTLRLINKKCIEGSQWFDVEYGIYFTRETGFFIFSRMRSTSENITKSCLTSEIHSIFKVKTLNFRLLFSYAYCENNTVNTRKMRYTLEFTFRYEVDLLKHI